MKNETIGLEGLEVSELIRELRLEKNIPQNILYEGLCKKKVYFQLENGEVVMDEYLSERLFSRLHVQYKLIDIMLDDNNFWQKECRHEINLQMRKQAWEKAESLLKEYEERAPKTELHAQYVLAKSAEIHWKTGQENCGQEFLKALEMTMPVSEVEEQLKGNGVISEDELMWYFCYRSCNKPFSAREYLSFLECVEKLFLSVQIYAEVYFEAAYQCVRMLYETEQYVLCREVCQKAISWLKRGVKSFYLAELYYQDAKAGMQLRHDSDKEKGFLHQCRMAYYVSLSFGETETAEKMRQQCEEEFGWHITD